MKWTNWRIYLGALLLLLGGFGLLQSLGLLPAGSYLMGILFGGLFLLGGLAFLSLLLQNRENWWASFPGVVLLDLGLLIIGGVLAPGLAGRFGGVFFLAGLSFSFWLVYLIAPQHWWSIIPGGVLLTLAAISGIQENTLWGTGGLFFLGLALTFGLLGMLRVDGRRMNWPWIPAGVLLVLGVLFSLSATQWMNFVWPAALILAGVLLVFRTLVSR
ncbi:MAG: hypothetical protein GYA59_03615 [Chloroflexi bacterium]|nr:hypothetical protein [Chloroflexota bacterium]